MDTNTADNGKCIDNVAVCQEQSNITSQPISAIVKNTIVVTVSPSLPDLEKYFIQTGLSTIGRYQQRDLNSKW